MLETLDYTIRIGSTPTFLYFDLYLYSAYAAHHSYDFRLSLTMNTDDRLTMILWILLYIKKSGISSTSIVNFLSFVNVIIIDTYLTLNEQKPLLITSHIT